MKELTIEEKAKRYDEALERAKKLYNDGNSPVATTVEEIFPELKESEDERIGKELIEFVKSRGGFKQEYIAWLEKQGKKKYAWDEEDEKMCQETIDWFEKKCFPYALESENPARESINWLKSIKQKIKGE